jgi:hypothetical protein
MYSVALISSRISYIQKSVELGLAVNISIGESLPHGLPNDCEKWNLRLWDDGRQQAAG